MVMVGRWSERGGEIVPAVIWVSVRVASVRSMSVAVLWTGSWRVGVVMVVWRLFSMRRFVNGWRGRRLKRLLLKSPVMLISVLGLFVRISSIAFWKFFCIRGSLSGWGFWGLLYRLIVVCMGLFFC